MVIWVPATDAASGRPWQQRAWIGSVRPVVGREVVRLNWLVPNASGHDLSSVGSCVQGLARSARDLADNAQRVNRLVLAPDVAGPYVAGRLNLVHVAPRLSGGVRLRGSKVVGEVDELRTRAFVAPGARLAA